jgi:hypothetical protein
MIDKANHTPADDDGQPVVVSKTVADWFHYSVIRSRSGLFAETVTLTPEMARLFLSGNDANRAVNQKHIDGMVSDIVDGRWCFNGESLKIATDGRLADGQHRCYAVIAADAPIKTVVIFGVAYDSRLTTDQNRVKGTADYLSMQYGTAYATTASVVAGYLLRLRTGYSLNGGGPTITKVRIRAEYEKFQNEIDSAVLSVGTVGGGRPLVPNSMLATALVLLRRKSPSADDFIEKLKTGKDLSGLDPILKARETLIRSPRMTRDERMTLIMRAFDHWSNNREVSHYKVKKASR